MTLALLSNPRSMNAAASALVAAVALAGVAALVLWALRNPVFAIRQVMVFGDTNHNSAASLQASALPRLSGNFFSIDLQQARQIFQSVPWVRHAQVQREFPGRLNVRLQEHVAAARWGEGDTALVNVQGEVFDVLPGDADDQNLPRLLGPLASQTGMLEMLRLLDPLLAPLGMRIARLELADRGDWRVQLDKGLDMELGHGSAHELAERVRRFAGTAAQVTARHRRGVGDIELADLRHPGGYALRLRGVNTLAPAGVAAAAGASTTAAR